METKEQHKYEPPPPSTKDFVVKKSIVDRLTSWVERVAWNRYRKYKIEKRQETGGTWKNWSENVWYDGPRNYIKYPRNEEELRKILQDANERGITVRASGQRHSQPPQIVPDSRTWAACCCIPLPSFWKPLTQYVIDMSFYQDIEDVDKDGNTKIVNMKIVKTDDKGRSVVAVNAGCREDDFTYFVTKNNLALKTVTAGGFFSLGGMTSNDVHGGSINRGIFADGCVGFTIMKADGTIVKIDKTTEEYKDGFRPIQFARVNLGLLGIVTQVFVECDPRPTKQSLQGRMTFVRTTIKEEFSDLFVELTQHDRLEVFYDPYTGGFLSLLWDLEVADFPGTSKSRKGAGTPNEAIKPDDTTQMRAIKNHYGAKLSGLFFKWPSSRFAPIQDTIQWSMAADQLWRTPDNAADKVAISMGVIANLQVQSAFEAYSETWLNSASQVIFMSYFVEITDMKEKGMEETYDLLQKVTDRVTKEGEFHITGPMEFRFVRGGDSIMSGTYVENPEDGKCFVNLDLLAFVNYCKCKKNPENYPRKLLKFFADVERDWYNAGGLPHQGKMYGFFDPTDENIESSTPPFNETFIAAMNKRRDERTGKGRKVFNDYRKEMDPNNMFLNEYMDRLVAPSTLWKK